MLEDILKRYFDLDNDKNEWEDSYSLLVALIYDLGELGVLNSNKVVDELDKIDSEVF